MTREEREARLDRDLTVAFRAVFGAGNERTKEQRLVLARLRQLAKPGVSLWLPGQDETALAFAQGRLRMWSEIDRRIGTPTETVYQILGINPPNVGVDDDE